MGLVEETGSLFAMSPEGFPLVVFGGNEPKGKTAMLRDRKTLPTGKGEKNEEVISPHESTCMLNPYDTRCIVGVRQVEDGDGSEGRLKRLLDGPPLPRAAPLLNGSAAPISTVPVARPPGDDIDDERWYNENTSNRVEDVLTIPGGRSNILSRLNQAGKWEALLLTILFGVFSAWFLWKRVGRKEGKKATVEDHRRENRVLDKTHMERDHENTSLTNGTPSSSFQNTLLENETAVHRTMSTPPPPPPSPPPVIMNGHANPINDITIFPTPILPTPSTPKRAFSIPLPSNTNPLPISQTTTPLLSPTPLPSTPTTAGVTDDNNEDSDAEAEVENGAGATTTPGKRKARRGKRGKKKRPGVLGGEEVGSGSGDNKAEKEKADKDLEGGEKASSLILTTSSPKLPATPTPSLIVSDTILGTFHPFHSHF